MRRDWDLCREILRQVAEKPAGAKSQVVMVDGYDRPTIDEHVRLLSEAGFIELSVKSNLQEVRPVRLTWAGNDFLESIANDTVWRRTTETLAKIGGAAALDVVKHVAAAHAKDFLGRFLPGAG